MTFWEYLWAGSWITKWLWHLNWNSNDASGNGNNWTDANITYWLPYWKFWQGALFNGSSSKISIPTWAIITGNWARTFIAWVKPVYTTSDSFRCIMWSWENTSWYSFMLWLKYWDRDWKMKLRVNRYYSDQDTIDVKSLLDDWKLHMVAVTYNWVTTWTDTLWAGIRFWIDWTEISRWSLKDDTTFSTATTNSGIWTQYWSNLLWNWLIDEVIIENRAWTATEIKKYYTYAKWRFWI